MPKPKGKPGSARERREKQEKFQSFNRPKLKITRTSEAGDRRRAVGTVHNQLAEQRIVVDGNECAALDPDVVAALEALDPAEVERLLEPAQVLDRFGGSEVPELEPLEAILAASESARLVAGDVAPASGNGNGGAPHAELSVG